MYVFITKRSNKMKKNYCYLCLSLNKQAINITKTELQYVYEKLADIKLNAAECWMCYICHTRLRQCLRLQKMAIQTRGLVNDLCQNKIKVEYEAMGCLLELSISKTKIISNTYPSSDNIKQESAVKTGPLSDDENLEYTSNEEDDEKSSIKFEVEPVKQEYLEISCEQSAPCHEQKIGSAEMKIEIEGIEQGNNYENTNGCETDRTSETQAGCQKTPLSCDVCVKTFTYRSALLRHSKTHTGEKPHKCDICLKKFADKNNLKKHQQTHTGDKRFNCEVCFKKFIQKSALTKHTRVHTGEKPFTCDICSKKFSIKQSLENHIRTHTGDKPFGCDICSKKFIERSTLLNHMKTHTGEKPFMCDICSKKFSMRAALNNHMRGHTGDKPFSCSICFKKFSRSNHLSRHRKIHKRDKK